MPDLVHCMFVPDERRCLLSRSDAAICTGPTPAPSRAGTWIQPVRAYEVDDVGPIAQSGQSRRLITGRSQVRILVGPSKS